MIKNTYMGVLTVVSKPWSNIYIVSFWNVKNSSIVTTLPHVHKCIGKHNFKCIGLSCVFHKGLPLVVLCQYVQLYSFLQVHPLPDRAALTLPETQMRSSVPGHWFHRPLCCTDEHLEHCFRCRQVWVTPKCLDKHAYFPQFVLPWLHSPQPCYANWPTFCQMGRENNYTFYRLENRMNSERLYINIVKQTRH